MQSAKNTKNYYQVLGVLDEADDLVIRAAYIALMQRYDLAKWQGNKQVANKKLSELNDAYAVLSDRAERIEYDQAIAKQKNKYEPPISEPADLTPDEADKDWKIACDYYQDLSVLHSNLKKISEQLAFTFQLSVLQSKDYSGRNKLAAELEHEYLKRYFGSDLDLINFGKELIIEGQTEAATELNEVFRVMGQGVSAGEVIERISEKYKTERFFKKIEEEKLRQAESLNKRNAKEDDLSSPLPEEADSGGGTKFVIKSAVAVIIFLFIALIVSQGFLTQNISSPSKNESSINQNNTDFASINSQNKSCDEFLVKRNKALKLANKIDAELEAKNYEACKGGNIKLSRVIRFDELFAEEIAAVNAIPLLSMYFFNNAYPVSDRAAQSINLGWRMIQLEDKLNTQNSQKNYLLAYELNRAGYELGHPEGASNIGYMSEKGLGFSVNIDRAVQYYEHAIAMGQAHSMQAEFQLAEIYRLGKSGAGVQEEKARDLYSKVIYLTKDAPYGRTADTSAYRQKAINALALMGG